MSIGRLLAGAVIVAICVWLPWAVMPPIMVYFGLGWHFDTVGQWGDSFGAISSLFTALGFAGVVATFWMQREQTGIQQKQLISMESYQHRERFENSYFMLLQLLRETKNEVRFIHSENYHLLFVEPKHKKEYTGAKAFRHAWYEYKYACGADFATMTGSLAGESFQTVVHDRYESNFGPYFRLVYTILRRVDEDEIISRAEKWRYGNLLRAQITSYEAALIGLNALSSVSGNAKYFIEEFRLLKYLPEKSLRRNLLTKVYHPDTFIARD